MVELDDEQVALGHPLPSQFTTPSALAELWLNVASPIITTINAAIMISLFIESLLFSSHCRED